MHFFDKNSQTHQDRYISLTFLPLQTESNFEKTAYIKHWNKSKKTVPFEIVKWKCANQWGRHECKIEKRRWRNTSTTTSTLDRIQSQNDFKRLFFILSLKRWRLHQNSTIVKVFNFTELITRYCKLSDYYTEESAVLLH